MKTRKPLHKDYEEHLNREMGKMSLDEAYEFFKERPKRSTIQRFHAEKKLGTLYRKVEPFKFKEEYYKYYINKRKVQIKETIKLYVIIELFEDCIQDVIIFRNQRNSEEKFELLVREGNFRMRERAETFEHYYKVYRDTMNSISAAVEYLHFVKPLKN